MKLIDKNFAVKMSQRILHLVFTYKNCVIDNSGLKGLMKILCISAGTVDSCTEILKEGHLLFIIPGGAREAFFSDSDKYDLVWNDRLGFAKAAIRAKAVNYN